jgi:hypothetical protein
VTGIQTEFEFVLPRGYLDETGALHRRGMMRLATARDELQPLRDPTIASPDDPRLTILVLARVVQTLGTLVLVTPHEIEGLFAADLAYLQDFYGVINFGTQEEIDALLAAQSEEGHQISSSGGSSREPGSSSLESPVPEPPTPEDRAARRRAAIEEVPSGGR